MMVVVCYRNIGKTVATWLVCVKRLTCQRYLATREFSTFIYISSSTPLLGYGDIILEPGPHSGRVDVYLRDGTSLVLGTLCAFSWTTENSAVVCRQLGFRDFGTSFDYVRDTELDSGTGPIGNFACLGSETHLSQCFEFSDPFCIHSEDVVVYCQCE